MIFVTRGVTHHLPETSLSLSLSLLPPMSRLGTSFFTAIFATSHRRRGCSQPDEGAVISLSITAVLLEVTTTRHW
jgi:hypothetical protein